MQHQQRNRYTFMDTARLVFSNWSETDTTFAQELWGNPNVTRFISATGSFSEEEVNERLNLEISKQSKFNMQYWPVFQKSDGAFVGCCGLRIYDAEKKILELGFHICEPYWGKGFAKEAATKVISYAFSSLSANMLFAGHHPQNHTSKNLLLKLGFQYTHNELYPPTGLHHPSYRLTLLKHNAAIAKILNSQP